MGFVFCGVIKCVGGGFYIFHIDINLHFLKFIFFKDLDLDLDFWGGWEAGGVRAPRRRAAGGGGVCGRARGPMNFGDSFVSKTYRAKLGAPGYDLNM